MSGWRSNRTAAPAPRSMHDCAGMSTSRAIAECRALAPLCSQRCSFRLRALIAAASRLRRRHRRNAGSKDGNSRSDARDDVVGRRRGARCRTGSYASLNRFRLAFHVRMLVPWHGRLAGRLAAKGARPSGSQASIASTGSRRLTPRHRVSGRAANETQRVWSNFF